MKIFFGEDKKMIDVERLTKRFGAIEAINDVSFNVEKGEVLGFLGPNGAGKTTTMRVLTCYFSPTGGNVTVDGLSVFEDKIEIRKRLGYLPEKVPIYKDIRVKDYLMFVAGVKGVPSSDQKIEVERVISICNLEEAKNRWIEELSKGFTQRVGIAQALVGDPPILILDEPTIGLDPKQIIEMRNLIKGFKGKKTIILSTHILSEVSILCSKVIIINKGKIIAQDTPKNLTGNIENHDKLILNIEGPKTEVMKELRNIVGVEGLEPKEELSENINAFILEIEKSDEIRKNIANTVVSNGWGLLEMRKEELTLEDIFIKLIHKNEG